MMSRIAKIFKRLQAANPQPKTELIYHNHFQLLVAVILSAQSTDKVVNQVTEPLFKLAPDAKSMMNVSLEALVLALNRLGLHQQKAGYLYHLCRILVADYAGDIPRTREALEALPGVGRKTANVVLNTAFAMPVIAVDTHIFRVARRLGLSEAKTPLGVEQDLQRQIPKTYLLNAHHWLILHGRYICQARKPQCSTCFLQDICPFKNTNVL